VTRHLAIVGATASGKSALALSLAEACGDAEIVSLDSMQVYREMDIGTAKPTPDEQGRVRHHLVDVADPAADWSVRQSQLGARAAIADIEARGGRAILVGGTGLYVRAVVDDLAVPPTDAALRDELDALTETPSGLAGAYARLRALDPDAAARIEPNNRRRIVRALEVVELTGQPFSASGPGLDQYGEPAIDVTLVGMAYERGTRAERIGTRFVAMRAAGFVDEVRALAERPGGLSRTARQAIGYREVLEYLGGQRPDLDDALDAAVIRTRQFARRQDVWFRRDPRITWFEPSENGDPDLQKVLARWGAAPADRRPAGTPA
jgi:tRNA dimethylallyltransferase